MRPELFSFCFARLISRSIYAINLFSSLFPCAGVVGKVTEVALEVVSDDADEAGDLRAPLRLDVVASEATHKKLMLVGFILATTRKVGFSDLDFISVSPVGVLSFR